jgi:hypothetical protein
MYATCPECSSECWDWELIKFHPCGCKIYYHCVIKLQAETPCGDTLTHYDCSLWNVSTNAAYIDRKSASRWRDCIWTYQQVNNCSICAYIYPESISTALQQTKDCFLHWVSKFCGFGPALFIPLHVSSWIPTNSTILEGYGAAHGW